MRILLDANILLTYITQREDPYLEESRQLVKMCADGSVDGFMAFHALSVVWYVVRKIKGRDEARQWLEKLCQAVKVEAATHEQVLAAVARRDFSDFEDCLVDACAAKVQADYIVTANVKDFKNSTVKTITPDAFLAIAENANAGVRDWNLGEGDE